MAQLVLSDGLHMAYADAGSGRPLLLVHGWGANQGFFDAQRRALESGFRGVTVDLRAHGASTATDGRPSVELLAADLVALAETLDFNANTPWEKLPAKAKKAVLYGHPTQVHVHYKNRYGRERSYWTSFEGAISFIERRHKEAESDASR